MPVVLIRKGNSREHMSKIVCGPRFTHELKFLLPLVLRKSVLNALRGVALALSPFQGSNSR